MTWDALWNRVNREAEEEYRYQRDRYEFAMRHLWQPRFVSMSTPALYAFIKDMEI